MQIRNEANQGNEMKIRIITDGNKVWLAPQNKRLPAGNFEYGPRDENGIRETMGIVYVDHMYGSINDKSSIAELPSSWID